MNWTERTSTSFEKIPVTPERMAELEKSKSEGQPVVEKEADKGQVPFNGLRFQPVKSPGLYEAEFTKRGKDLVFHFWPYGHHSAQRRGVGSPRFPKLFQEKLTAVMQKEFGPNAQVSFDRDMTSFYVLVQGWGEKQFFRELAVAACEKLHLALGGETGRSEG